MKMRIPVLLLAALGLSFAAVHAEEMKHDRAAMTNPGFERLKALVGTWETTDEKGKPATVTYDLTAGGSALQERLDPSGEPGMITMYSADGPSVLMTHYCGVGNQPRMRATGTKADSKMMDFKFVDCANLASADAGHMHHLMMSFGDGDHFSQEWTWRDKGKDQRIVFHFARKKTS